MCFIAVCIFFYVSKILFYFMTFTIFYFVSSTPVLLKYFWLFILSDILYAPLKNPLGVSFGIVLNVYINL